MRTSQATRYARWAAYAALLLAVIVAGVFTRRSWEARLAQKKTPPAVPPTVQQRSAEFSFSKVEQDRTLFTVRASRATEFKEGNRSLLEDVWITIYGKTSQRFDNIHTQSCNYLSDTGRIFCAGDVQMDLESAEDAGRRRGQPPSPSASEHIIHVATSKVSFDRDTGEAHTDQPVIFHLPYGDGHGVGVTYSSHDAAVRLHRDVALTLTQAPASRKVRAGTEPVTLTGRSMEYRRDDHTLRLSGPVSAQQGHRELTAGEMALELDADLHAKRLVAGGEPVLRSANPGEHVVLSAHEFVAFFHRDGWAERVRARGNVRGSRKTPSGDARLEAQELEVELVPRLNEPRVAAASGNVLVQSNAAQPGGGSRRLETAALQLFFAAAARRSERRLDRAETLAAATLELQGPNTTGAKTELQTTWLRGQHMTAEFGERNRVKDLTVRDGVEVERRLGDRPPQVSTSRDLVTKFGPGRDWTEIVQTGNVRLREADRTAQADRARYDRAADSVTLAGSVLIADPTSRTTTQAVSFNQRTGEITAQGNVRSIDTGGRNSVANLAPQPAYISSERLGANSSTGHAIYSGHARLWQGDSIIEADSIELVRDARLLNARGNVIAVFPQAAGSSASGFETGSPAKPSGRDGIPPAAPDVWRVHAGTLTYWSGEARARLEQSVSAQSRQAQISSRALELFFSSAGASAGAPAASSTQQLARAVATGNVVVRQGDRRGTGERAEYTAAEGKFVLSGGRPTLYDASRGTTTGRQLTFFFADDTIVVDSGEGSRTLTRHRVEK